MIAAVSTLGDLSQTAGVIVAALLAAAVLLARSDRARAAAMLGALVLTPVLLVANIWSTPQIEPLRDRPLLALGAAGAVLLLLALGAFAIHRKPELIALAAAAALPFRVPIESGGDTANLLLPLYLVIAAGALAYAVPRLRATPGLDDEPPAHKRTLLEWLLAGMVVLYAAQAAYSSDFDRALSQVIFFYVPFALLYALLVRVEWTARLAGALSGGAARARRRVRRHRLRRVRQARAAAQPEGHRLQPVRVLLPRQLAVLRSEHLRALSGDGHDRPRRAAAVVSRRAHRRRQRAGARAAVGGARADAVAVLVHGAARRSRAARRAALGDAPRGGGRGAVRGRRARSSCSLAPGAVGVDGSADNVTSGRSTLITGGIELARDRPVTGWGAGVLPPRVPRAGEDVGRARLGGVAHDPDHRRRRAGRRRAGAVPRAAARRDRWPAARRARVRRAGGGGRGVRRARRAHAAVRGVPRGPARVGAAGGRRRSAPGRRGDAAPRSRRARARRAGRSRRRERHALRADRLRGAGARRRRGLGARADLSRLRRLLSPAVGARRAARRTRRSSRRSPRRPSTRCTSRWRRCCRSPARAPTACSCS